MNRLIQSPTAPSGATLLRAIPLLFVLLLATTLAAQETQLSRGTPVRGSLAEGDTAVYIVSAGAGTFVRATVEQLSVDVALRILGPDGEAIRRVNGPERGFERFQFETEKAGGHRIEVFPAGEEAGDFVILVERLEPVATDPGKLADQLLSVYDREDSPGAVVSVFRDGKRLFAKAYGMADLTHGIPYELDTPTNIGSTSKQFTALAVMLLVERGQLALDDDVRKHIPELPDFGDTVRVRNLLTHTSGYREFLNLLMMGGFSLNHGDFVDRSELIEVVKRQPALQNEPGSEFNYNNTSFGLLATIVERVSGQSFPEFMKENVFQPLGMTRSWVRPSPEHIIPGRSVGYIPAEDGTFREAKDVGGAVGAGGIYTTVIDLQKWIENYWKAEVGTPETFQQMMTSFVLTNGDTTGYGFGLFLDEHRGLRRVNHGGADVAHRSQLYYYPEIKAGLTTQSNHAGFDGSIASRLAEAFFGDAMEPVEEEAAEVETTEFDPAAYDPEAFDEFVGQYALDAAPTFVLTFSRSADTLFLQATGQPRISIEPVSESTFIITSVGARIEFHRNEDGEVDGVTLHQNGAQHATRLEGEVDSWEPTADDLEEFAGRYFSEELETFYTLEMEEEELHLRHRRMAGGALEPSETDTFSGAGLTLSFERDRNGQIIGFYASNGRARDVRFERVR